MNSTISIGLQLAKALPFLIPIALVIAGIASVKERRTVQILICAYIWAQIGLNTYSSDYASYYLIYSGLWTVGTEQAFVDLCSVFRDIGFSYFQFRMLLAAIIAVLLFLAANRLTQHGSYVLALYIVWPLFTSVSGIRFALVSAVVCFAIPFLLESGAKGVIKYFIVVLIASAFHNSAIIYCLFVLSRLRLTGLRAIFLVFFDIAAIVVVKTEALVPMAGLFIGSQKAEKWFSLSANTEIVHLNLTGIVANSALVLLSILFAILVCRAVVQATDYAGKRLVSDKTISSVILYRNAIVLCLLIIPFFIISSEYQRLLFGLMPVLYAIAAESHRIVFQVRDDERITHLVICIASVGLAFVMASFYVYSTPSADIIGTMASNLLFVQG